MFYSTSSSYYFFFSDVHRHWLRRHGSLLILRKSVVLRGPLRSRGSGGQRVAWGNLFDDQVWKILRHLQGRRHDLHWQRSWSHRNRSPIYYGITCLPLKKSSVEDHTDIYLHRSGWKFNIKIIPYISSRFQSFQLPSRVTVNY